MIHCFDLATGKLEIRPIPKVYGLVNMYKDLKSPGIARRLEEKLSVLESQADNVIQKIHDSLCYGGWFQIERRDLNALQKVMQIMCYRKHTFYFDGNEPVKFMGADFLKHMREYNGRDHTINVWLIFLGYLINTPHNNLMDRAFHVKQKIDFHVVFHNVTGVQGPANFTPEDFAAIDYNYLDEFHLGFVEAADGTEFVLSNNTFGLWEGRIDRRPAAHRLFVLSPRVALILRSNLIIKEAPHTGSIIVHSALVDIPIKPPHIHYSNGRVDMNIEELLHHRASAAGQCDTVSFKITKLTKQQTHNVNAVILLNARKDGSITFLSKDTMCKTVEGYMTLRDPLVSETRARYAPLMNQLISDIAMKNSSSSSCHYTTANGSERDDIISYISKSLDVSLDASSKISQDSDYRKNKRINTLLDKISAGKVTYRSKYDRARCVYQVASKEESAGAYVHFMVEQVLPFVIAIASEATDEAIQSRKEIIQVNPFGTLVESLPVEQSTKVMATIKALITDARALHYGNPDLDDILYDAVIFGLINGFVKEWGYILPVLIPGVPLVECSNVI